MAERPLTLTDERASVPRGEIDMADAHPEIVDEASGAPCAVMLTAGRGVAGSWRGEAAAAGALTEAEEKKANVAANPSAGGGATSLAS